jgi:hypothetical protein
VSISAKHASSVGQGFLRSKNILRESAVHFVSSIQSTSAKICAICGRQNFASSTQSGKGSKGAKDFFEAKKFCENLVYTPRQAYNQHLRKSAQSARDKASLVPRKAAKEASEVSEGAKDFFEAKIFCENLLFTPRQAYNQHRRKSA